LTNLVLLRDDAPEGFFQRNRCRFVLHLPSANFEYLQSLPRALRRPSHFGARPPRLNSARWVHVCLPNWCRSEPMSQLLYRRPHYRRRSVRSESFERL
jgi:hypothetical protein